MGSLPLNGKLKYWGELDNILPRHFTGVAYLSGVTTSKMISKSIQQIETSTEVQQHTLNFLSEQLPLLFFYPKGRGYSIDMLICAVACLDRAGLIYPSNLHFNIIQCSYSLFNMCVSSSLES